MNATEPDNEVRRVADENRKTLEGLRQQLRFLKARLEQLREEGELGGDDPLSRN